MSVFRRFSLSPAFARLIRRERSPATLVEGHFPDRSDRRSFLRIEGDTCFLLLQELGADGPGSEERVEVSRAQGEVLLDVCAGKAVYERIALDAANGVSVEVERYTAPQVVSYALVTFPDNAHAEAFRAPVWFGPEVSADEVGDARRIALGEQPKLHDGAITNGALESLIDYLEQRMNRFASRLADDGAASAARRLSRAPEVPPVAAPAPAPVAARSSPADSDAVFEERRPGVRRPVTTATSPEARTPPG
ncbi:MAG: hypothetical protein EA385_05110 [Salinarimonadaceae bacterium]|nr:MAG: hypothetical protein EA385_05110 [Salinarimonadaceae bacterium]